MGSSSLSLISLARAECWHCTGIASGKAPLCDAMTLNSRVVQRLDSSFLRDDDEPAHRLVVLVARRGRLQRQQLEAGFRDRTAHIFRGMGIAQTCAENHATTVVRL